MNSLQKTDLLIHVFMCGLMVMIQIPSNMLTMVNSGGSHLFRRNSFFQFGLKHFVRINVRILPAFGTLFLELMCLPAFGH